MLSCKKNINESFDEDTNNLEEILRIKNESIEIKRMKCCLGSNAGDNYMSVVKRIFLKGLINNSEDFQMSLIIKRQIPSVSRRELYRCDAAFNNEINAYNYIIPMLKQNEKNFCCPECYFAGTDKYGEIIILEDLKDAGYKMEDRITGLNFEHCRLVMQELAAFHAASLTTGYLNKELFQKNTKKIQEIVYCDEADDIFKALFDSSIHETLLSLKSSNIDGKLSKPIELIEKLRKKIYKIIRDYITCETNAYKIFCHGDLWINNIMFKRDSSGKLDSVKFIDLQTMRLASPVFDILHFIYTSTKRDLRETHLHKMLAIYYTSLMSKLEKVLSHENSTKFSELKQIFCLKNITEHFYANILYGFAICVWILPAVTFDPNNIPNLDKITLVDIETTKQYKNISAMLTSEYHSRIRDIALEFYENGFLDINTDYY